MQRITPPDFEKLKAAIEKKKEKSKGNVSPLHEFILKARTDLGETATTGDGSFGFYLGLLKTIPLTTCYMYLAESKNSKEPIRIFWWKIGQLKKTIRESKSPFKIGDKVFITKGPLNKVGKIGIVETILTNGCMVKLNENQFTPVQFKHLQKVL